MPVRSSCRPVKRTLIPIPPKVCWPTYRPRTISVIEEEAMTRKASSLKGGSKIKSVASKNRKVLTKKTGQKRTKTVKRSKC